MSEPAVTRYALGVDIGTSAVKAALLSSAGASDSETSGPPPGQSARPPDASVRASDRTSHM